MLPVLSSLIPLLNFLRLPTAFILPPLPVQAVWPTTCSSTFFVLAWIFFFTFLIFPDFRISHFFHLNVFAYYSPPHDGKTFRITYRTSFWPIFHASCVSKLFECIISSRLLFFLKSNSIFSLSLPGRLPPWTVCFGQNFSIHFG